jgi:glycerol-3-phosphate dehydrogenase subunit B
MRFDTVIVGGGLAGLVAGISLLKAGRKTAIVSTGQNALHFFSGCFESFQEAPPQDYH